jgi:DNA-binding PadR family transcriptional regulator
MDVADGIFAGMGARTSETVDQFVEENGLSEGLDMQFVQTAYGFAPEPVTPQHFVKRAPYGNPDNMKEQLAGAAGRGWLETVGEAEYRLTAKGREVTGNLFAFADGVFGGVESLPAADLRRIITLLTKVVETARALPEPAEKWALSWGTKFERRLGAPLMVQVRRRLIDLFAFRDDVHIAAWQPYGVDGQVWETFTYVWRGEAGTAAELVERLPYRNYDEAAYVAALRKLVSLGWIAEEEGRYVATEKGKKLRQDAEDATDRYFDAAWAGLSEAEMNEARVLLENLAEAVKVPEEDAAEEGSD